MPVHTLAPVAVTAAAYLLGSIPFGLLITRLRGGEDIRRTGSGNIGAANVTRVSGAGAGVLTLLLDAGKGALAVWLASRAIGDSTRWIMVAALAALAGHVFPVWLRFRGGKGVATAAGAIGMICAPAIAGAALLWLILVVFWRYVSLGSIAAAAALPLLVYFFYAPHHAPPDVVSAGVTLMAILVIVKHRSNLERLLAGTENKLRLGRKG